MPGFTVQFLQFVFGASNLYFQNVHIFFKFPVAGSPKDFFQHGCLLLLRDARPLVWKTNALVAATRCQPPNSAFPCRFVSFYGVAVNLFHLLIEIFFYNPVLLLLWHNKNTVHFVLLVFIRMKFVFYIICLNINLQHLINDIIYRSLFTPIGVSLQENTEWTRKKQTNKDNRVNNISSIELVVKYTQKKWWTNAHTKESSGRRC